MQISLSDFQREVSQFKSASGVPSPEQRHDLFVTHDPYPEIAPTLLHAGYLASYAVTTGMIEPFDVGALEKPATYLVPLEGPVRYLDENGKRCSFYLSNEKVENERDVRKEFELNSNSICYVTLKPRFRMPAYIAGRFNLLIRDVYRGLLVGTGPLVDPGFSGFLSIPVHNFTSNKYILRAGEGFVYFEFTKLGWRNEASLKTPAWVLPAIQTQPPFPVSKQARKTLDDYLTQATGTGPAQNAIQKEIVQVVRLGEGVKSRLGIITYGSVFAGIVLLITTVAAVATAFQIYLGAQQFTQSSYSSVSDSIDKVGSEIGKLRLEIQNAQKELEELKKVAAPPSTTVQSDQKKRR